MSDPNDLDLGAAAQNEVASLQTEWQQTFPETDGILHLENVSVDQLEYFRQKLAQLVEEDLVVIHNEAVKFEWLLDKAKEYGRC